MIKILAKLKSWNLPKSKSRNFFRSKKVQTLSAIKKSNFLIFDIIIIFAKLAQTFIQILIFWYFDWKYYIQIKINTLHHIIENLLNWLTNSYITTKS